MLTSKQRAELRAEAQKLDAIIQIGKDGISLETVQTADQALYARKIIKINVLDNSGLDVKDAAYELALKTKSDVVQVIGNKFVLYKKTDKETRRAVNSLKNKK